MKPERDRIFRNSIRLIDNQRYQLADIRISDALKRRARQLENMISRLAERGRLDATDLEIIAMRSLSPMPSMREVGHTVNLSKQGVCKRVQKIQNAIKMGV